ncbi:MAG: gamma-glutamylcyclotransferase family protein [Nannocystaceae bacterium]|nr:gamma-glutamylcyclotransferase [Myxococcales bacterium]
MTEGTPEYAWSFAFGSNLHPDRRGARTDHAPLEVTPGRLAGWRLAFNMPALHLIEPSMASAQPAPGQTLHGLLLRLTPEGFASLLRSEGGDRFYEAVAVDVDAYDGRRVRAYVLRGHPRLCVDREIPPSRRYMQLIREGARRSGLDPDYCAWLESLPHAERSPLAAEIGRLYWESVLFLRKTSRGGALERYVDLLHRCEYTDPPALGHVAQAALLAPAIALGAALRLRRRLT